MNNLVYLFDRLCACDTVYSITANELVKLEEELTKAKVSLNTSFDSKEEELEKIAYFNEYKALVDQKMIKKLKLNEICMKLGASFAESVNNCTFLQLKTLVDMVNERRSVIIHKAVRIERNPKFTEYFNYLKILAKRYSQYLDAVNLRIKEREESNLKGTTPGK